MDEVTAEPGRGGVPPPSNTSAVADGTATLPASRGSAAGSDDKGNRSGRRVKRIALVSHSNNSPGAVSVFNRTREYERERDDFSISLVNFGSPIYSTPDHVDARLFNSFDGIFALTFNTELLSRLAAVGLPLVCNAKVDVPGIVYVDCDYPKTAETAAAWFLERRFRNFAIAGTNESFVYDASRQAFIDILKKAGFDCFVCDCTVQKQTSGLHPTTPVELINKQLDGWIPSLPRKTAVLAYFHAMGRRVIDACIRCGRAVPDDIAVMCVGDNPTNCLGSSPRMTCVDDDSVSGTRKALDILLDMIDKPELRKTQKPVLLPPLGVVERESTDTYAVDPPWLAKALKLIDDSIDRPISPAFLARTMNVSHTTLQSAFSRNFSMTPTRYILSVKMREAKRLIDAGGFSVKELAAKTGFASQSYFTRAYTSWYGRSPSEDAADTEEQNLMDEVIAEPGRDGVPPPSNASAVAGGTATLPASRGSAAGSDDKGNRSGRRVKRIAFVVHSVGLTGVLRDFNFAKEYARERGDFSISLVNLGSPDFDATDHLSFQVLDGVDGINAQVTDPKVLKMLAATGLPLVNISETDEPGILYVDGDFCKAAEMAAAWFLERRFRNFAVASFSGMPVYYRYIQAFKNTLKNAGFDCIVYNDTWQTPKTPSDDDNARLVKWVSALPRKTAVLTCFAGIGRRVIASCRLRGRAVPDDIAVMSVGTDPNLNLGRTPRLSYVEDNLAGVTRKALDILLDMIDHPELRKTQKPVLVPPLGVVEQESTNTYAVDPPWFAETLKLIDDSIDRPISPASLAKRMKVSHTTLQSAFSRNFKMTPTRYILSRKMHEAKRLIKAGGLSVKELAARTGFASQSYFTRAYAAWYGRLPSEDAAGTREHS